MPLENLQNGRYLVLRELGSGSMGEVYLVDDTAIGRKVAIKLMRSDPAAYPDEAAVQNAVKLFRREAQAIARLEHPTILPIYDFGEEKQQEHILRYMVMPYCQEGSLLNWLQQNHPREPLTPEDVAYFVELAGDALQYAHEHGVIHQDVKPPNFLLRTHGGGQTLPDLLLADFGIAKLSSGTTVNTTNFGPRGTPRYMPPEQWESKPVPASDQYALAVMAYQLLTRTYPFQGEQMHQVMYQHFHIMPQPPSQLNPRVPSALDAVILRGLAKKPEERFPSIKAFATAFHLATQGQASAQAARGQISESFATTTMQTTGTGLTDPVAPPQLRATPPRPSPNAYAAPTFAERPSTPPLLRPDNAQPQPPMQQIPSAAIFRSQSELYRTPLPDSSGSRPEKKSSKGKLLLWSSLVLLLILAGGGVTYYFVGSARSATPSNINNQANQGNPYTSSMPTLRYTDPLSQPGHWTNMDDGATEGYCHFQLGGYDVTTNKAGTYTLCGILKQPVVSDMTFEVQMQILHGNCGGIIFRSDFKTGDFYYFDVCFDGGYYLNPYQGYNNSLAPLLADLPPFPALQANSQAIVTIAVVAQGSLITLYINHQQVAQVNNSMYSSGQISLFSYSGAAAPSVTNNSDEVTTEVIFKNARLWTP